MIADWIVLAENGFPGGIRVVLSGAYEVKVLAVQRRFAFELKAQCGVGHNGTALKRNRIGQAIMLTDLNGNRPVRRSEGPVGGGLSRYDRCAGYQDE